MFRPALVAALLFSLAGPTFAQSDLDRLEVATEASSQNLEAFLVATAPTLADVMPEWSWDAEMRTAANCTLDAIRAEAGDDAVAAYLDAMEDFAETEISSMLQASEATPIPINPDVAMRISTTCGTADIAIRRMQESGLLEAMMSPEVLGLLMAD